MKKEYILFIDSGIGGLTTLAETTKILNANYIYFADSIHAPYGSHSAEELLYFLREIIENLLKTYNIRMIVLACNTATASCVEFLREIYPKISIIGTEPALKIAVSASHKRILALTTPTTAKQHKYLSLKQHLNSNITELTLPDLAKNVELFLTKNTFLSRLKLYKNLCEIVDASRTFDCIVLGCTHYVFLKEIIIALSGKIAIDGNYGVAKQVAKIFNENHLKLAAKSHITFLNSSSTNFANQNYKKILSQILAKL